MGKKPKKEKVELTPIQKAEGQIKLAYVLAFISAGFTILMTVLSFSGISPLGQYGMFNILLALVFLGLGFGILKKNRVCAVILFSLFCLDKLIVIFDNPSNLGSMAVSLVIWGGAYFGGISGTFNYHKLRESAPAQENEFFLED